MSSEKCCVCICEKAVTFIMPCCGVPTSSMVFCTDCVQAICDMNTSTEENVGKCPVCTKHFKFENGALAIHETRGCCRMCCQDRVIVSDNLCSNCLVGQSHTFRYICGRCSGVQRIPHPMWQYQTSPDQLGSASWACHVGCHDYTYWRIHPEDVERVPNSLQPGTWSAVEANVELELENVRNFRNQQR